MLLGLPTRISQMICTVADEPLATAANCTVRPPHFACDAGKLPAWDWRGASLPQLWQRAAGELGAACESLGQLFSPALRRTTALLQLVWTAGTFAYYGVVLLAATVGFRLPPTSRPQCYPSSSTLTKC